MNIEEAFPSKYLKAADLQGQAVIAKIATVKMEKLGEDNRPMLYFVGKDKGLPINKSNKNKLVELFGAETDDWTGQTIEMFVILTDYKGEQVEAIRLRAPRATAAARRPAPSSQVSNEPPPFDPDF